VSLLTPKWFDKRGAAWHGSVSMRRRTRLWTLAVCVAAALGASAAPAAANALIQVGCLSPGGAGGCADSGPLVGANALALGPEGRTLYVAVPASNGIAIFDRDPASGALTRRPDLITGNGLSYPVDLAISGDGSWLVVGSNANSYGSDDNVAEPSAGVSLFERDPATGGLEPSGCMTDGVVSGCSNGNGLGAVTAVAIDATGTDVYAASWVRGTLNRSYVAHLRRAGNALQQPAVPAGCKGPTDGCGPARAIDGASALALAPDGEHLYVASWVSQAVAAFDRAPATGLLTQAADASGCAMASSGAPTSSCEPVDFLNGPGSASSELAGLAFGANDRLYVAQRLGATIGALDRHPGSGALIRRPGPGGCASSRAGFESLCNVARTDVFGSQGLATYGDTLVVGSVYAAAITSYGIDGAGSIAPVGGPFGCIMRSPPSPDCAVGALIAYESSPADVAFSPDGRFLYTAVQHPDAPGANGGLQIFKRDTAAPVCADRGATTLVSTVTRIQLQCGDADGDAVSLSIAGGPANGVVGTPDSGAQTVDFAPAPGFVGRTTFTYRASALGREGAPATVTVDVVPAGPPGDRPRAKRRINSTVRPFWVEYRNYVVLRRLRIARVPRGAKVQLRCSGRGCPFKRRAVRVRRRNADASKATRKGKLRKGAVIQVRITKPGMIGKVVLYRVPKNGLPVGRIRCLPPGANKPARC
jgi:sugar lactone lactonase YvrE